MFLKSFVSFLSTFWTLGLDFLRTFPTRMTALSVTAVLVGLLYPLPLLMIAYAGSLYIGGEDTFTLTFGGFSSSLDVGNLLRAGVVSLVVIYATRVMIGMAILEMSNRWQPRLFRRLVESAGDADSLVRSRPRIGQLPKVLHAWAARLAQAGTQISLFFVYSLHTIALLGVLTAILLVMNWKFFALFIVSCVVMLPIYALAMNGVRLSRSSRVERIRDAQKNLKAYTLSRVVDDAVPSRDGDSVALETDDFVGITIVNAQHKHLLTLQLVSGLHVGAVIAAFVAFRGVFGASEGVTGSPIVLFTVAFIFLRSLAGFISFMGHLTRNYENLFILRNTLYPRMKPHVSTDFVLDVDSSSEARAERQSIALSSGDVVRVIGDVPRHPMARQPIADRLHISRFGSEHLQTYDPARDEASARLGRSAYVIDVEAFKALEADISGRNLWFVYGKKYDGPSPQLTIARTTNGLEVVADVEPAAKEDPPFVADVTPLSVVSSPGEAANEDIPDEAPMAEPVVALAATDEDISVAPIEDDPIEDAYEERPEAFFQSYPNAPVGSRHRSDFLCAFDVPPGLSYPAVIRFRAEAVSPDAEAFDTYVSPELRDTAPPHCLANLYIFDADEMKPGSSPDLSRAVYKLKFRATNEVAEICIKLPKALPKRCALYMYQDRHVVESLVVGTPEIVSHDATLRFHDIDEDGSLQTYLEPTDLSKSWRQDGRRIFVEWLGREFYMDCPEGFDLGAVTPERLKAAEVVLFDRCEHTAFGKKREITDFRDHAPETLKPFQATNIMLAFSTGEDSTAALALLPEDNTIPYYVQRAYRHYRTSTGHLIDLGARLSERKSLDQVPNVVRVPNTFETIGLSVGTGHGFRDGFGYGAIGLLLCDHFDANTVAFGSVMEQAYLRSGNNFTDVLNYVPSAYNRYRELFISAGTFFALPTGYMSEVLTNKICALSADRLTAVPCPKTSDAGEPCGSCFKCFRKTRLERRPSKPATPEVSALLSKRPLKSATSVIVAAQRDGYEGPEFQEYMNEDLGFVEKYFGTGLMDLMPASLHDAMKSRLQEMGIHPMSDADERRLRDIALIFAPSQYDTRRTDPARRVSQILEMKIDSQMDPGAETARLTQLG